MENKKFYLNKIEHNKIRIEKVSDVIRKAERLHEIVCSPNLRHAMNSLMLIVDELLAENKHIEGLLQNEPSNTACSGQATGRQAK